MDKCQFSEFSYGYCLTEDLIVGQGTTLTAAPVFPSLVEEGQPSGGYDVRLERPGVPLFLQFKLVHQMVTGNANEAIRGHFWPPFYRMHLRRRVVSDQHASLVTLEQSGNEVYYVAPGFHTTADLNTNYANRSVWNQSFRLRPAAIGFLPDDRSHHVTFTTPTGAWRFYSEESTVEGHGLSTEAISERLIERIIERGKRNFKEQVRELDANLVRVVRARNIHRSYRERMQLDELGDKIDPIRRVAYIARQFFDCQLLFITLK